MLWFNCGNRDRLSNFNGETCEYDGLGNPTVYRDRSLEWSRVKDLVRYDGAEFAYDAFGLRTSKIHNGNKTKFLWAGDRLLSERRASEFGDAELGCGHEENDVQCAQGCGNADERLIVCPNTCPNAPGTCGSHNIHSNACPIDIVYLHGVSGVTGLVISKKGAPDRTYYYRKNVQGDVTHILDINGNVKAEYAYDAWGNHKIIVNEDNIADINPFRYRSYYFDSETNLYYLRSRYYDPETGRFINADDIGVLNVTQDHINGLNLYAYCLNNPVNMHDENGHLFGWIKKAINWVGNNIETIAAAAVVVGLVAVTIATAGMASPLLLGVLIGASIGGAASIATQLIFTGTVDLKQFFVDVAIGAVLGAVGGSALGKVAMTLAGAGIGFGSSVASDIVAGRSIDLGAAAFGGVLGALPGMRGRGGAQRAFKGELKTTRYHQHLIKNNPAFSKPGFSAAINRCGTMGINATKVLNEKTRAMIIKKVPNNLLYSLLSFAAGNIYKRRAWF